MQANNDRPRGRCLCAKVGILKPPTQDIAVRVLPTNNLQSHDRRGLSCNTFKMWNLLSSTGKLPLPILIGYRW